MPFGSLGVSERIRILLDIQNAATFIGRMNEAAAATAKLAASEKLLKRETEAANAQTFIQRQGLYTLRRYAFYATNAFTFMGIAVGALGLQFYNTMQTGSVAFRGFLGSAKAVDAEMKSIYATAALTPFTFPDLVTATRRLLPFTKNLGLTNKLVMSLANSLAAAGIITGAALSRGSLALAHMFAVGRLTGQILYQLGRDNIPMQQALQKEFNLTGEAVRERVAGGLITAQMAAQALNRYIAQTPGYSRAAINQATKTLSGAASTLKDLLGMSVGGSEAGLFSGITRAIRGVDLALLPLIQKRKPITLTELANAFDKQLSPKTHIIINLFTTLKTTLRTIVIEFGLLFKAVQLILRPFDYITGLFGGNRFAAKLLGIALGTLITLWIIGKTRAFLFAEAEAIAKLATVDYGKAVIFANGATRIFTLLLAGEAINALRTWAFALKAGGKAQAVWGVNAYRNTGIIAKLTRAMFNAVPAIQAATVATWGFTVALLANPITWIVLAVVALTAGLVILYIKWQKFHDLVNNTFDMIMRHKLIVAAALGVMFAPLVLAAAALRFIIQNIHRIGDFFSGGNSPTYSQLRAGQSYRILHPNHKAATVGDLQGISIPGAATGGYVTSSGTVMVGEHGRELVTLPQGASVAPISNDHLTGQFMIHVYPQDIYMSGQKVGEAIGEAYLDKKARR